jgi:hypothetical protein
MLSPGGARWQWVVLGRIICGTAALSDDILNILEMVSAVPTGMFEELWLRFG